MANPAAPPGPAQLLAERAAAQLLSGPPGTTAEAVAGRLLAIQGQDPRGARLAIRARSTGLTVADVDQALTVRRTLVTGWLNRGTLHLVRSADYWPLHQLTTPPLHTGCFRRLGQEGIQPDQADRGVAVVERALRVDGPLTRAQLGERLSAAGLRTAGQALVYLLFLAGLRGRLGARPDGWAGAGLRAGPGLAGPATRPGPGRRTGLAGPPLPGGPWAGDGTGPGQVVRPAAARCRAGCAGQHRGRAVARSGGLVSLAPGRGQRA